MSGSSTCRGAADWLLKTSRGSHAELAEKDSFCTMHAGLFIAPDVNDGSEKLYGILYYEPYHLWKLYFRIGPGAYDCNFIENAFTG